MAKQPQFIFHSKKNHLLLKQNKRSRLILIGPFLLLLSFHSNAQKGHTSKICLNYLEKVSYYSSISYQDSALHFLELAANNIDQSNLGNLEYAYANYVYSFSDQVESVKKKLPPEKLDFISNDFEKARYLTQRNQRVVVYHLFKAIEHANRNSDNFLLAQSYLTLSEFCLQLLYYDECFKYSYMAITLFEKENRGAEAARATNILANSYLSSGNIQEGMKILRKTANLYLIQKEPYYIGLGYHILGNRALYASGTLYSDSANYFYSQALKYLNDLNTPKSYIILHGLYINQGVNYTRNSEFEKSLIQYKKAISISNKATENNEILLLGNIADSYEKLGLLDSASWYIRKVEIEMDELTNYSRLVELSFEVSSFYERAGKYEKALKYKKLQLAVKDSLTYSIHKDSLYAYKLKYKYQKEQAVTKAENNALLLRKEQIITYKDFQFRVLIISIITLLTIAIGILLLRIKLKRKNKEQNLRDEYLELILSGQQKERKKIARMLHDNYGATLAALRFNLWGIYTEPMDSEKRELKFNQVFEKIDLITKEIRTLSHNLIPYQVDGFNLQSSLRDLLDNLLLPAGIKYHLNANLLRESLPEQLEHGICQIAVELTNNALKHSNATMIKVSLTQSSTKLVFTYEDNGKANPETFKEGVGQKLIKAQLIILKGEMTYNIQGDFLCCTISFELNSNIQ